ncbi:MAG TPA: hypothetical protein VFQ61_38635 [Polyangiaceae bacterium]|nr:hypothetical protein [Polyangiaceae bacterium]
MKNLLRSLVITAGLVSFAGAAWAGDYHACKVTDVQHVKVGTTNYFVFKANCSDGTYFWSAPTDAIGTPLMSSLVTTAFTSGRLINVQCGMNGGSCGAFSTKVYDANVHTTQTVWTAETVNLR